MRTKRENVIVGLDVGTTKICAIVGEVTDSGVNVIGVGQSSSMGLRKGVVINIESTVQSIREAIEEAELMAGCEITSVYTGIAGGHIKGFNSHGVIALKEKEVRQADMRRVIEAAKVVNIPVDHEVIHTIPQEFIVDEQDGIKNPSGMSGQRLEVKVHIVTAAVASAQNLIKCVNRAGLNVTDIVLQPLASGEACLSQDEKELGVALLDIGGGTTDIAIFVDGSIKHTAVLALGGAQITSDVSVGLQTPYVEAERIKKEHGCAMVSMVAEDEEIEVPTVGNGRRKKRLVARRVLAEVIEARVEEILQHVQREIARAGFEDAIVSGLVVTGGTAMLEGLPELAERIFDRPVRPAAPEGIGGLADVVSSPMYSTGVGLIFFGSKNGHSSKFKIRDDNIFIKVLDRMKAWFVDLF